MNNSPSILLIDDDRDDQLFFLDILNGIEGAPPINVVQNGKEALDRIYRSLILPTLIFMDINMPLMDGIECLQYIKEDPLIKHIPVIMLSSSLLQREEVLQLGAKAFIQKTGDPEALQHTLVDIILMYFPIPNKRVLVL